MLRKVISGGQVGVDIAALRAAKRVGLETGGAMPKGFKAKDGFHPEYAEMYGMVELASLDYRTRTHANVRDSNATLLVTRIHQSPGSMCTVKAAKEFDKALFQVSTTRLWEDFLFAELWLRRESVETLNVAGNSLPELEQPVEEFLVRLFEAVLKEQEIYV